ncbi:efflux RND transporter periplasmic adaptor subunit [Arsukibacterium indicum]|uniref:Efflux RND transporter periplasmic adaptor subunit n=1 Tax=Arsukibacterium indicum TaxID=2848612 RepID=A0ABS6MJT2_9GAMM|nr:efflux RND transporter periplasmic adaptor subunit [Arsukibacterium indicum]MBV2129081.1 efflux RND transporter periplasmic adaptor subunit [Arsukibacterium indicum]
MLKKLAASPVIIAVVLALVLLLWLLSGDNYSAKTEEPAAQQLPEQSLALVETRWSEAEPYQLTRVAQGQVLPWRRVSIKSQQAGTVNQLLVSQGDKVEQGDKLLRLSDEGRSALLVQAQANLTLRQNELASAQALGKSQFVSETELTRLKSELATAEAELERASLAVQQLEPVAPFAGVIDRRHIEVGDVVQVGTELLELVQIDKLKVTAQIPQQHVKALQRGQQVNLRLLDGRQLSGELSFISYAADNATRSFYIEVTVANPELLRIAGGSATVEVLLPPVQAHLISPALLSLNSDGQLGISLVNEQQQVEFHPVTILSADNEGARVTGLPDRAHIITQGAGFAKPGDKVQVAGAKP